MDLRGKLNKPIHRSSVLTEQLRLENISGII